MHISDRQGGGSPHTQKNKNDNDRGYNQMTTTNKPSKSGLHLTDNDLTWGDGQTCLRLQTTRVCGPLASYVVHRVNTTTTSPLG